MSTSGKVDGFNYIYSTLVGHPDDLLGIVAYSFYKQQKIEFMRAFSAEHDRAPHDAELRAFHIASNSPASIAMYRAKADSLARDFVRTVLAREVDEVQERSDQELNRLVRSFRPNFWLGVAQSLFSSVLFVLLIGVIVFVAWSSKFGAFHVIGEVMGVEIRDSVPAPRSPQPQSLPGLDGPEVARDWLDRLW